MSSVSEFTYILYSFSFSEQTVPNKNEEVSNSPNETDPGAVPGVSTVLGAEDNGQNLLVKIQPPDKTEVENRFK